MDLKQEQATKQLYDLTHAAELGSTFEQFATDPVAELQRIGQYDAMQMIRAGYRPLLPGQVRLRQQLEARWAAEGHSVIRRGDASACVASRMTIAA